MDKAGRDVWVFGDYRNYFQNRVTLQLLARGRELAAALGGELCVLVLGHELGQWVEEYVAHGADRVLALDHPCLRAYQSETYTRLLVDLALARQPRVILVGATSFGRELAARAAKRLHTGLTADCVELAVNDQGLLVQTAPGFGGNLLAEIGQPELPTTKNLALNERDYGDLSGLNKDDARKKWGEDQVLIWRRSYDVPPPGGESLKDTLARALPYYVQEILPCVLRGQRVLVAAHGNSLRALIMVLEKLTPEQILKRELATGVPIIYQLNADSTVATKLDLAG